MGRRIITRPITLEEQNEVRELILSAKWQTSTSEQYRDAPHSYIVRFTKPGKPGAASAEGHWERFADLIKNCGVYRTWRGKRMKYLILDGMCYWVMWPILNRAEASTLDGYKIWGRSV